jgi:L-serine dehydratase
MISFFDLFKVGIGPSSSHTVGPMVAAGNFARELQTAGLLGDTSRITVRLHGSLAMTGKGHGTDLAVMLGLQGEHPETVAPDGIPAAVEAIRSGGKLRLLGERPIDFTESRDLIFDQVAVLPYHINGMRFTAAGSDGEKVLEKVYYSVGGGFVVSEEMVAEIEAGVLEPVQVPFPFSTAAELLGHCQQNGLKIWQVKLENEKTLRSEDEVRAGILRVWSVMQDCVQRGFTQGGQLPGGLQVRRRAPALYEKLRANPEHGLADPLTTIDWVNLYALAVNEENAAGGRVVTAPTNGAAGIIPAVAYYYQQFVPGADEEGLVRFFLTAAAIGVLYKLNASISGAEVGCQGEVGVACSMAAAGLAEVRGGTIYQVENAAEIGMEHNLGLTCDPVGGLVQIPCIERNAMGAVKAINAARIALRGDGEHHVSLDNVIATMRQTGEDMNSRYKETSLGGLAVSVVEC